jgi:ABC-2 type transport system ATP-binding protein
LSSETEGTEAATKAAEFASVAVACEAIERATVQESEARAGVPPRVAAAKDGDRSIGVEQLTRRFGDLTAVDAVDLQVPSGQIFGFLGPNGAGKSTLVKVLTTILAPSSGRATVAGYDVARDGDKVRAAIGVALQDVGLDALMTARELLVLQARLFGMSSTDARRRAERLLQTVDLADVGAKKRTGEFSGGMKRRLDLALALVHDPRILFLDEPTTGLDPVSRMAIWEEVRRLNRDEGVTMFLTTQYLEEADRLADQVAIINKGRLVARGTPMELKRTIGNEAVTLSFLDSDLARRADGALAHLAPQRHVSGHELVAYYSAAADMVAQLVRALDAADIPLLGLAVSQPTLDDVFLQATGVRLSAIEQGADEPVPDDGLAAVNTRSQVQ